MNCIDSYIFRKGEHRLPWTQTHHTGQATRGQLEPHQDLQCSCSPMSQRLMYFLRQLCGLLFLPGTVSLPWEMLSGDHYVDFEIP